MEHALSAYITRDVECLKAELSNGKVLFATDPQELGRQLFAAGVHVDNTHCADWRAGDIAPMVGQAIALKWTMRHIAILFLDFDGVLHPFPMPVDAAQLFCNLPRLEAVLRDFPDVQIVISSSWREDRSLAELTALFSPDIAGRIIGVLPVIQIHSLADAAAIRHLEIKQFLRDRSENWIALDDDADLFPNPCSQLIQCIEGFNAEEEAKLRKALHVFQNGTISS